jgi:uncharacterized protein (TIGR03000 family)
LAKANQATVIVQVPADARLYVDGERVDRSATTHRFLTPPLEMGRGYFYTLKAEATRNGQTVSQAQRVIVRASQVSRVDFGDLSSASAIQVKQEPLPAPAHLTVRVPEKAQLFVDDVACPQKSGVRSFDTPQLEPGKTYHYTLRLETVEDGQKVAKTQRVELRAGKQVEVDFTGGTAVVSR